MADQQGRPEIRARLGVLAKEIEQLEMAKSIPLPMISMAYAMKKLDEKHAAEDLRLKELLAAATDSRDYSKYLAAWEELFSLAVNAAGAICQKSSISGSAATNAMCHGFERGIVSFARYPISLSGNREPVQAWQTFNAGLVVAELQKEGKLPQNLTPLVPTETLSAVWNVLDSYTSRMPRKGKLLRKMAVALRGDSLAGIVVGFNITSGEITKRLQELHAELQKNVAYPFKAISKIGDKEALGILRLISEAYKFLPGKPGRECPDAVELALLTAGLAKDPQYANVEAHSIRCRACAQNVFRMGEVAKNISSLSEKTTVSFAGWPRIEAFLALWNGKQVSFKLKGLTVTIDSKPSPKGVNYLLHSAGGQQFSVQLGESQVLEAKKGEIEVSVSTPTMVGVGVEGIAATVIDLPAAYK